MIYPTISEYIESILSPADNFDKLSSLRPVLDDKGRPVMSSGNFAVVFKMQDQDSGRLYAIKCFIKDQSEREESYQKIVEELSNVQSSYLCGIDYLPKELFVDTSNSQETEFPVLKMDWVEGLTLDKYIQLHLNNPYDLTMLTYQFCRLAAWLQTQPFAHGDLKPDNILVKSDGTLTLVDYDGMYVPSMKGEKAHEMGSPDYRHPLRTADEFNEWMDDFALAVIALSLKAISLDKSLYEQTGSDHLLFTASDYRDLSKSPVVQALQPLMSDSEFNRLYGLFLLAHARKDLSAVSFRLFNIARPEKGAYIVETISTEATEEELKEAVKDEYGVKYSKDGKKLLGGVYGLKEYCVKEGTVVICDSAFSRCYYLQRITLPDSVTSIGDSAFDGCYSLRSITLPDSVTSIGDSAFDGCYSLQSITIPDSVTSIGDRAFGGCSSLQSLTLPDSVTSIGDGAFTGCRIQSFKCLSKEFVWDSNMLYDKNEEHIISCTHCSIEKVEIPNSVTSIGDGAFSSCSFLQHITLPDSVTSIGDSAFSSCNFLQHITLPNSVTSIGDSAFDGCYSLQSITIPDSVTSIGDRAFHGCRIQSFKCLSKEFAWDDNILYDKNKEHIISCTHCSIEMVEIPDSVTSIGDGAFIGCLSLQSIIIPNSVTSIGDSAFVWCRSLPRITLPDSVTSIGDRAFAWCLSLQSITLPDSVTSIGDSAFIGCSSLQSITLPDSVTSIGDCAFDGCSSLHSLTLPDSVTSIGDCAFDGCKSLQRITIPDSVTSIGEGAFNRCSSLPRLTLPDSVTSIGDRAFNECSSLQRIIIPQGTRAKFEQLLPDYKAELTEQ